MKRLFIILFSLGTLLAVQQAFGLVNTSYMEAEELTPQEAETLAYLWEMEKYLRDLLIESSGCWASAEMASAATEEQDHMDLLKGLLNHYGLEVPVPGEEAGDFTDSFIQTTMVWTGLGYVCLNYDHPDRSVLANMLLYEEMAIWNLLQAISQTDKQRLLDAYNYLLAESCAHLRQFHMLSGFEDWTAEFLSQEQFDSILAGTFPTPTGASFTINAGLNDAWYYPSTDGQGFFITVFPDRGTLSLAWFTFDTVLPGVDAFAHLGDPGQRWLIAHGAYEGSQATLTVKSVSGGLFDAAQPEPEREVIGSIILQFEDCSTGSVTYDLPTISQSGVIPIERVASDNIALCEALNDAKQSSTNVDKEASQPSSESCYVSEGEAPTTVTRLFAVWGSNRNDVFVAGGSGTILHYDGTAWTPMVWGAGPGFEGVWGSSATDVYAVGGADGFGIAEGRILHYDGSCWREVFTTTEYQFTDVWGSGSDDVFATTSRGPILHYDGTGWTPMEAGAEGMDGLGGVWGTASDNVFAVGGDTVWHYDGSIWQAMATVYAKPLRRVWGSSATDVFAVGTYYTPTGGEAVIWHYDGTSWELMPSDIEGQRWSVWGNGLNNVFTVGDDVRNTGLISHYDGIKWRTTRVENTPTLQGVWGSGWNDVYAVGGGARNGFCCTGEGTILHFDGNSWKTVMEYGRFN